MENLGLIISALGGSAIVSIITILIKHYEKRDKDKKRDKDDRADVFKEIAAKYEEKAAKIEADNKEEIDSLRRDVMAMSQYIAELKGILLAHSPPLELPPAPELEFMMAQKKK